MSKLKELIDRLCPDGVEYKTIGEIANCYSGATPKTSIAEYWTDGTIRWMSSGEVNKKIILDTDVRISQKGFDSCSTKIVPPNSVVIALAGQGKTRGLVALTKVELCTNQSLCAIVPTSDVNSSFLYHYLASQYQQLRSVSSGDGTRGGLNLQMVKAYRIPVPPIEVQDEIAKILDRFADYAAELQAELQARKEQYEYYRNLLLTFNPSACGCGTDGEQEIKVTNTPPGSYQITWKTMGEICENMDKMRKPITASKRKPGIYPYYGASGIVDYVENYIFDGDFLLISEDGANLLARSTPIAFPISGKNWVNNHAHVLKFDNAHTQKYIQYYINMIDVSKYVSGGAQPKLNQENLNSIRIPIPPIELQEKIVAILDRFETLVNDLTQGLPAEIAAVKEQYEYYRNKLLTFKQIA